MKKLISKSLLILLLWAVRSSAEIPGVFIGEGLIRGEGTELGTALAEYQTNFRSFQQDCFWLGGNSVIGPFDYRITSNGDEQNPTFEVSATWECWWYRRPRQGL